ncbi:hypothetical protein [Mesorhizobium sp.]|uniref:hypothetical protein n=1 Tax=Mesorhizobium sp. TaxID=1871066 RepID=UPI0026AF77CD
MEVSYHRGAFIEPAPTSKVMLPEILTSVSPILNWRFGSRLVPFCEGGELSSANAAPEVIAATAIPIIGRFKQMREISDIGGLYRRTLAEARPVAINWPNG